MNWKAKGLIFLVTIILNIGLLKVNAQNYRNETSKQYANSKQSKKKVKAREYKSNIFKFNLSGLLFKSAGIQYERKFHRKISFATGLIYRPKGSWYLSKLSDSLAVYMQLSQESKFMYSTSKYRSFMITPEGRYYLGRQAPRGLYIATFLRFKFDRTNFNFHYYDEVAQQQKIGSAYLNESMMGGGVMLGMQLIHKNQFTIDLWFLGPWVANNHVVMRSKLNMSGISELQQKFISQDLKTWFQKDKEIQWTSQGIETSHNHLYIGARIVGINIGYSF